jgi:hypothetical protein
VLLVFQCATQFAQPVEEHCSGQCISGLPFV